MIFDVSSLSREEMQLLDFAEDIWMKSPQSVDGTTITLAELDR